MKAAAKASATQDNLDFLSDIEGVDASGKSRKYKLLEEETRLRLIIDSITIIGNEDFKADDGKVTTNYKLGIGFTSNREQRYEDGEGTGRKVSFFRSFTFSFHEKSVLVKSGLIEALGYDTSATGLTSFLLGSIGKQVSAMITHRKYKTPAGQDGIAMDIEKFKPVAEPEDFSEALAEWTPHFVAVKKYPDKKIVTVANVKERSAPKLVNAHVAGEKVVAGKIVDLE